MFFLVDLKISISIYSVCCCVYGGVFAVPRLSGVFDCYRRFSEQILQ